MAVGLTGDTPGWRHDSLEDIEASLLLEAIHRHYGFDFRQYSPASLRRRLHKRMTDESLASLSQLQHLVLHDETAMERLLLDLSINVTAMFRDPGFYEAFRERVVPLLRTYPYFRVWHAGCSTGEEVYSMAILLHEAGLLERARIYATDMNEAVLERARSGIFPVDQMKDHTTNYVRAGGTEAFSDYYLARYDGALFHRWLTDNVVFAQHNLATDGPFNEFHVIICRNVMIYFDTELQTRVHDLFHESLVRKGVLALGAKETIRFTSHEDHYDVVDQQWKLYRRRS
ncbi:MAG: methyltransferase, CheR-type, SAM-binding domain, C-terminal [Thermoleophilia bacterium]|nr:methyltransferase, CheR-type, SAM-binding domain, C-terminal [Thermoleophilia bacterium]